jgi:putative ABC transport system permease protein
MDIFESVKMAVQTLVANRMRSALTMLGIIIGNASVIAMIGVGEGAQRFVAGQLEALGPNVLFVTPGSKEANRFPGPPPQTLVLADAVAIAAQVPSVTVVAPELNSSELVSYRNKNFSATLTGTTPDYLPVRSFEVAEGRFFTDLDVRRNKLVVALGSDTAKELFGDGNPIGQQVRIKDASFQVIGVMKPKGSSFGMNMDETVFLPVTTMANRIVGRTSPYGISLTVIYVNARNQESMDAAQFQIENLLRLRHKIADDNDFTVQNQKDLLKTTGAVTGALTVMLAAVASISLFVGGIGIMNIMLVSVTERTREIGLRKAIGASERDILFQFIIEAVILSVTGGLVGILAGGGGVFLVGALTPLKAGVSPAAVALATGVSGAIGLFFGVVPASRAAKLDPIVALRSE